MLHIYILKDLRNTECSFPYTMTEQSYLVESIQTLLVTILSDILENQTPFGKVFCASETCIKSDVA